MTSVQLGYLHQFDYRINDEIGRDFLVVGVYVELERDRNRKSADAIGPRLLSGGQ
jgi:hypothetical protein